MCKGDVMKLSNASLLHRTRNFPISAYFTFNKRDFELKKMRKKSHICGDSLCFNVKFFLIANNK